MAKRTLSIAVFLFLWGTQYFSNSLYCQEIETTGTWPDKNVSIELAPAEPMPGITTQDSAEVGWVHFWMFDDGVFSRLPIVERSFTTDQDRNVALKVRGKYTDNEEPPRKRTVIESSGPVTNPTQPLDSLDKDSDIGIFVNWDAARIGDSVYFAVVVRNLDKDRLKRPGRLNLMYARNPFTFRGEVFPSGEDKFGDMDVIPVSDSLIILSWELDSLQFNVSNTLFLEMQVTDKALDSISYNFEASIDWADETQNSVNSSFLKAFNLDQSGDDDFPNGSFFSAEAAQSVNINRARDPNDLLVMPTVVPPSKKAPPHLLVYEVQVENIGNAHAPNLKVEVNLDPRIDINTYQFRDFQFKVTENTTTAPTAPTVAFQGNKATFTLSGLNLPPSKGGTEPKGKGSFTFSVETFPDIELKRKDKIISDGLICMINNNKFLEDSVATGPAIVRVEKPYRVPFGWLLGVKVHSDMANGDTPKNAGINLTFQVPLHRPPENTLNRRWLTPPKWFWQFELGWGKSTFGANADPNPYEVQYIHGTPVQIRYAGFKTSTVQLGLSAGYSFGYVYKAEQNGQKATLKSGLFDRLEHEFGASLDVFNFVSVPGVTLGTGYKYRTNNLFQHKAEYHFPFIYMQLNFAHFQRRQVQLWNKIYRW